MTPSIGISLFGPEHEGVEELLKKADMAMYDTKAGGRDGVRFFDPVMQSALEARGALEAALRRGLAERQFEVHYQVQVDRDGEPTGFEALVRWSSPERGLVGPGEFIPVAEETGLIIPLGCLVLEAACAQLAAWADDPQARAWTIAVNVSAAELGRADLVANIRSALAKTGADPRRLKIELTESVLIGDVEATVRALRAVKALGVGLSLDDFGTGYSSLAYLRRLPLDQLKIDRSFVRDVATNASDGVIARTIVALGKSLGLHVIAEGVETADQRDSLASLGCDAFQGYYYGRPVPAGAAVEIAKALGRG
jgi:EAL domain-containing protein (putative c-di-GMP-specific phosphodiesterase class I)